MKCDLCSRIRENESAHPILCVSCAELIARLSTFANRVPLEGFASKPEAAIEKAAASAATVPGETRAEQASVDTFVRDFVHMA